MGEPETTTTPAPPQKGADFPPAHPDLPISTRRVRLEDGPAITDLLCRLSIEATRLRYFVLRAFTPETAQRETTRMLHGLAGATVTLVATTTGATTSSIVAVAELVPDDDDATIATIALVVRDDCQGRGLGLRLLKQLIVHARATGVTTLRADLLAENLATRRLLDRLGLPISTRTSYGTTTAMISLVMG